PPAEGILVRHPRGLPQHATTLQLFDQQWIGILEELPADQRHRGRKSALTIDGLQERKIVPPSRGVVVLAERRRHVDDAGAVARGHERFPNDDLVLEAGGNLDPVEWTTIPPAHELRTL